MQCGNAPDIASTLSCLQLVMSLSDGHPAAAPFFRVLSEGAVAAAIEALVSGNQRVRGCKHVSVDTTDLA